jgi:hypothetical protein
LLSLDTGYDFIQPEFLDIIFFQQKNLVIFPYIDLKHLHSLQIFTTGYDTIDIDATVIHNLQEIVEYEKCSSYSQQPTFYFLYNVDVSSLQKLLASNSIRCIINTNENVENIVNDSDAIFFNKKSKKFINYTPDNLQFEKYIIKSSNNETALLEKIQQIKTLATKIYAEVNEKGHLKELKSLLKEYDSSYWNKILSFIEKYYDIEIPEVNLPKSAQKSAHKIPLKDFSAEYELIIKSNRHIAQEFVQLLHDYRSKHVNSANLEVDQLYYPQKLYNYLRNHHWKKGIPSNFVEEWLKISHTSYMLNENDRADFELLLQKLNIDKINFEKIQSQPVLEKNQLLYTNSENSIPPIKNFQEFKEWILKKLDELAN